MRMRLRHRPAVTVIILLAAIGVACGGSEPASTLGPKPSPASSPAIAPTPVAHSTSAPTATATPVPVETRTPEPPATATPTPVPTETRTPEPPATATPMPMPPPTATPKPGPQPPPLGRPCSDIGDVTFTAPPMDLDTIFYIRPMGAISGGHTTPTGHMYIHSRVPGEELTPP